MTPTPAEGLEEVDVRGYVRRGRHGVERVRAYTRGAAFAGSVAAVVHKERTARYAAALRDQFKHELAQPSPSARERIHATQTAALKQAARTLDLSRDTGRRARAKALEGRQLAGVTVLKTETMLDQAEGRVRQALADAPSRARAARRQLHAEIQTANARPTREVAGHLGRRALAIADQLAGFVPDEVRDPPPPSRRPSRLTDHQRAVLSAQRRQDQLDPFARERNRDRARTLRGEESTSQGIFTQRPKDGYTDAQDRRIKVVGSAAAAELAKAERRLRDIRAQLDEARDLKPGETARRVTPTGEVEYETKAQRQRRLARELPWAQKKYRRAKARVARLSEAVAPDGRATMPRMELYEEYAWADGLSEDELEDYLSSDEFLVEAATPSKGFSSYSAGRGKYAQGEVTVKRNFNTGAYKRYSVSGGTPLLIGSGGASNRRKQAWSRARSYQHSTGRPLSNRTAVPKSYSSASSYSGPHAAWQAAGTKASAAARAKAYGGVGQFNGNKQQQHHVIRRIRQKYGSIRKFQRQSGIVVDGVVGRQTTRAFRRA